MNEIVKERVEIYKAEHPDRNVWGSLKLKEIIAYLNGEEGAPSAKAVFDHYWSILEYALSDEEKTELLNIAPEEGVRRLIALGGGVWNTYVTVDLLEPYDYSTLDRDLEGVIDGYNFALPSTPIDLLRAGLKLGMNMSERVLLQDDFDFIRSLLVYIDDELVDLFNIDTSAKYVEVPMNDEEEEKQIDQELVDAEEVWANTHSYEQVLTMSVAINISI